VKLPGNDSGTLTLTTHYGSFEQSSFSVRGTNKYCTTYVGPDDPNSGTLTNKVTVYLRDNRTGLDAPLDPAAGNPQTFKVNENKRP